MARILIVEDDAVNAEVAQVMCHAGGHTCALAGNGHEALDVLLHGLASGVGYDLILCDVLMPGMDGLTLTGRLRRDDRFSAIPILGMTARASRHDQRACLEAGMNAVLTKPFKNRDFHRYVERVLTGWQQDPVA